MSEHLIAAMNELSTKHEAEIASLRAEVEQLRTVVMFCDKEHVQTLEREHNEALAQVAVLLQDLSDVFVDYPENQVIFNARALLDRLQREEAVVEAARSLLAAWNHCQLEKITPYVELRALQNVLAAWDEGKA